MKRSPPLRTYSVRTTDPFKNLNVEQLSYIGAIALLYNDVEAIVDEMCSLALGLRLPRQEVVSRINGVDGKLAIIKLGARQWGFDQTEMTHLQNALGDGGFGLLKKWRDAVVHAQVLDVRASIGKVNERQGKQAEVLLTLDALKGLFQRLDLMRQELGVLRAILGRKKTLTEETETEVRFEYRDQDIKRIEEGVRADWLRAQEHLNQRQSLPPIPEFPAELSPAEQVREMKRLLDESVEASLLPSYSV